MRRPGPAAEYVIAGWMGAGAVLGTALGATAELVGRTDGSAVDALLMTGGFGGLGALAWWLDRRRTAPQVLDAQGRGFLPLATATWVLPLVGVVLGLGALVVIGSLRAGSLWPGVLFALAALGIAWSARPWWANRRVAAALQLAEAGEVSRARELLTQVAASGLTPRHTRELAHLTLGGLALRSHDLVAAERALVRPVRGVVATHAAVSLALVYALQERYEQAEAQLRRARAGRGARGVQAELDGVRALLVMRREGVDATLALAEPLAHDGAGALLLGVLAVARLDSGDEDGCDALLDVRVRTGLARTGLDVLVPEIARTL